MSWRGRRGPGGAAAAATPQTSEKPLPATSESISCSFSSSVLLLPSSSLFRLLLFFLVFVLLLVYLLLLLHLSLFFLLLFVFTAFLQRLLLLSFSTAVSSNSRFFHHKLSGQCTTFWRCCLDIMRLSATPMHQVYTWASGPLGHPHRNLCVLSKIMSGCRTHNPPDLPTGALASFNFKWHVLHSYFLLLKSALLCAPSPKSICDPQSTDTVGITWWVDSICDLWSSQHK